MANLLTRLWRRESEISRYNVDDYLGWVRQAQLGLGGVYGGFMNPTVTLTGKHPAERVENSFAGYINGAFKVNPVVFGIMTKRASVLSEARFAWREKVAGKPGELYYDDGLDVLEHPWPNGTTGELIARMIQDADLAGNFYCVNEGDRLRRLRPDWVQIILTGNPLLDLDVDVLGYLYTAGGPDSGGASQAYKTGEICHWSPQPDPDALYRGMSWVTPVIKEIEADRAAVDHKLSFFRNGATLGPIIKAPPGLSVTQFSEFVEAAESAHRGVQHAYKTMYLAGGSDVTLASANMQQMEFTHLQGKAETRLCVAANIPAAIAGVSEGLHGSSLNAGNYGAAKREWADTWLRPTWRSACAALSTIMNVPKDVDLWYDECDITFLHEDRQDAANIAQAQMATINTAITAGFEPDAAVITVNPAWKGTLKHSGMVSVQLQTPGGAPPLDPNAPAGLPNGGGPAGGSGGDLPPVPPGFEPDATVRALQVTLDLVRATQSTNDQGGNQTAHVGAGSPQGGQFTSSGGGGGSSDYHSILPAASAYKSGSGGGRKAAPTGSGIPAAPTASRTMKAGDSGEDVRYAQYAMGLLGFTVPQDGHYDAQTAAAVKEMQSRLGVKNPNGHLSSSQLTKLQDAVRLSPCIGRSESDAAQGMFDDVMRGFDLDGELGDDEPGDDLGDEDEESDDETDAILDALDEWVESQLLEDVVVRAHDVAAELRIPGGKGGGRWTANPVGSAIAKALKDWGNGDGPDDPFHIDGKPIDRESLRKAAVARGITLKRGASRDDIAAALKDDVKGEVSSAREADKARKSSAKFSITHDGKRIDVAVYSDRGGKTAALRVTDDAGRPGRVITSQSDLAGLEKWASDNGHTDIAGWAAKERGGKDRGGARLKTDAPPSGTPRTTLQRLADSPDHGLDASLFHGDAEIADLERQGLVEKFDSPSGPRYRVTPAGREKVGGKGEGAKASAKGQSALDAAPVSLLSNLERPRTATAPSSTERAAFDHYGDNGQAVNAHLRAGGRTTPRIAAMDQALSRSPLSSDVELWRGVSTGPDLPGLDLERGDLSGAEFTDKAYTSTSADRRVAERFAHLPGDGPKVVMQIRAPAGTKGISLSGGGITEAQSEMLLERGLTFRVTADHGDVGGLRHLEVEVVPSDAPKAPVKPAPAKATLTAADREKRTKAMARQYASGASIDEIAAEHGVSSSTVHTSLTNSGVQLRPRGGSARVPAKKAAAKVAKAAPAHEAQITKARNVADVATEVHELVGANASPEALRTRLAAVGHRTGVDTTSLQALADDPEALRKAADAMAADAGLRRVGDVGSVVPFDRKAHIGAGNSAPRTAQQVTVVRPGYVATINGEEVPLSRATVTGIVAPKVAKAVPATDHLPRTADDIRELVLAQREAGTSKSLDADLRHLDDTRLQALHDEIAQGGNLYDRSTAKKVQEVLDRRAAAKADPLAGLEGLTTNQKRARLRSRGLSKAEIDALAPLAKRSEDWDDDDVERSQSDEDPDESDEDDDEELASRALGHDVTPGHDELHHYWTRGEGLAKWVGSPHQFTTLRDHLIKYVTPEQADRMAAAWVHEVTGFWPGSDAHRVEEGGKPRGHRIGPG